MTPPECEAIRLGEVGGVFSGGLEGEDGLYGRKAGAEANPSAGLIWTDGPYGPYGRMDLMDLMDLMD